MSRTRPGNAAFVPPPADRVGDLLGDLEQFIHDEAGMLPPLVRIALGPKRLTEDPVLRSTIRHQITPDRP